MRQGELFGLRWEDVDLVNQTVTVRHALQRIAGVPTLVEPKTHRSRRTIPLPAIAVAALSTIANAGIGLYPGPAYSSVAHSGAFEASPAWPGRSVGEGFVVTNSMSTDKPTSGTEENSNFGYRWDAHGGPVQTLANRKFSPSFPTGNLYVSSIERKTRMVAGYMTPDGDPIPQGSLIPQAMAVFAQRVIIAARSGLACHRSRGRLQDCLTPG